MTVRELQQKLQRRIADYDEAMLTHLAVQMDALERENRGLSGELTSIVEAIKERNKDEDPDEILRNVTEAVNADRQNRRR